MTELADRIEAAFGSIPTGEALPAVRAVELALARFSAMIRIRACWARMPEAATDIAASDWDRISAI